MLKVSRPLTSWNDLKEVKKIKSKNNEKSINFFVPTKSSKKLLKTTEKFNQIVDLFMNHCHQGVPLKVSDGYMGIRVCTMRSNKNLYQNHHFLDEFPESKSHQWKTWNSNIKLSKGEIAKMDKPNFILSKSLKAIFMELKYLEKYDQKSYCFKIVNTKSVHGIRLELNKKNLPTIHVNGEFGCLTFLT